MLVTFRTLLLVTVPLMLTSLYGCGGQTEKEVYCVTRMKAIYEAEECNGAAIPTVPPGGYSTPGEAIQAHKDLCDHSQTIIDCISKEEEFCSCTCAESMGGDADHQKEQCERHENGYKPETTQAEIAEDLAKTLNEALEIEGTTLACDNAIKNNCPA
jgi:hypothetical protein